MAKSDRGRSRDGERRATFANMLQASSRMILAASFFLACGAVEAPTPVTPSPPLRPSTPAATAVLVESGVDAGVAAGSGPRGPMDASPASLPAAVLRTGSVWPFHAWSRAEAVSFNVFAMRPEVPLHAYDDRGWSPHVVERRAVTAAQGKEAVSLLAATEGEIVVSKCPFPRHAVVLFDGDTPVASINLCFECGDILTWPASPPEPQGPSAKKPSDKERMAREEKRLKLYDRVFPRWRAFFSEGVGMAVDAKR